MFNTSFLTLEQLKTIKLEHPFHKIIYIVFGEKEFVFRTLTKKEYDQIVQLTNNEYDMQDLICQTTLIYPDPEQYNFAECPFAGLPSYAAEIILGNSNITNLNSIYDLYDKYKDKINIFDYQTKIIIKTAMPEYAMSDIENMTWEETMEKAVIAEEILRLKGVNVSLRRKDEKENAEDEEKKDVVEDITENKEVIRSLREQGIDPMFYFNIKPEVNKVVDYPLIGGRHWNDEETMNAIRQQIHRKR